MKPNKFKVFTSFIVGVLFVSCSAFREAPELDACGNVIVGNPLIPRNAVKAELRSDIVNYSKQYEGMSYRSGGKSPRTGFDCSGFTGYVFSVFDYKLSADSGSQILDGVHKSVKEVEPGDLIFYARSPGGRIFHVSMVIANDENGIRVIHSTNTYGVIETNITKDNYWSSKIAGARDIIGQ